MRIVLVVLLLLVAGVPSPAHAQWERGSSLLTLSLGYAGATSRVTSDAVNGGNLGVGIERIIGDQSWSFGALFYWISGEDRATVDSNTKDAQVYARPLFLSSRFWFGSPTLNGFGGVGLGWHHSSVETTLNGNYQKSSSSGLALSVPVGLNWFLADTVFLQASLVPIFMANAVVADDFAYLGNLGVGFKL